MTIASDVVNTAAVTRAVVADASAARICNLRCGRRRHAPLSHFRQSALCRWRRHCLHGTTLLLLSLRLRAPCHMLRSCALTCSVTALGLPEGCVTPSQRVSAHMLRAGLNPDHVLTLPLYAPSQTRLPTRQGLTTSGPGGKSNDTGCRLCSATCSTNALCKGASRCRMLCRSSAARPADVAVVDAAAADRPAAPSECRRCAISSRRSTPSA